MAQKHGIGSHVLVLTACIAPKAEIAQVLRRSDPAVRLNDYANALKFWLKHSDSRIGAIVFADNSGHPLDILREIAQKNAPSLLPVEFHSFDFPAPSPMLSYGHPEMRLLNATLETSPALASCPFFAKITGRYTYPDFSRLLDSLPINYEVAVDSTGARPWPIQHRSNLISGFGLALFRRQFYLNHLKSIPDLMRPAPPWNRQQFVEAMIYDTLYPLRNQPGVLLRWPRNCEPVGIGANGENYRGIRRRGVSLLRAVSRRIVPSLWT